MPFERARLIGASKAFASTTATAIPAAFALIAALKAFSISPTSAFSEPVHEYEQLMIAPASDAPYCVGTKNGFVVTWLTNTNLHFGWLGYAPLRPAAAEPANASWAESRAGTDSAAPPAAIRR